MEIAEVNSIAKVYGIKNDENSKRFFNSIVEVGTVSIAAKTVISTLKNIPGVNIAASILNAAIAGCIIAALGEGTIYIFEQIYLGKKSVNDIDWVTKFLGSKLSLEFVEKVTPMLKELGDNVKPKDIAKAIIKLFANNKN